MTRPNEWSRIEAAIGAATGQPARVADSRAIGGGCINDARALVLADGRRFFLKRNNAAPPHFFQREAEGLAALAAPGILRVPRVIAAGGGDDDCGGAAFLLLEWIEPGPRRSRFLDELGRALAQHHQATLRPLSGGPADNYIGSSTQPNALTEDWVAFWRDQRLGHQLELARRNGLLDKELEALGEKLRERLGEFLAMPAEPACLLHGDLWAGNVMADADGAPVVLDPAVYWGRREADLAMPLLFGGFDSRFFQAYEDVWQLAEGSEERLDLYKIYHLLNHYNLFGAGYRPQCVALMRRYAG